MTTPAVHASKRPIFIVGTQRSGTTLLRLVLDSHEHIAIGFESGFMIGVEAIKRLPGWNYGKNWYRRYDMTEDDLNVRIRAFYSSIFSDYAAARNKPRWGEKTPNVGRLPEMAAIFPDAQFIGLVRHVGAVAASLKRWKRPVERSVKYWTQSYRIIKRMAPELGPERLHVCRYEDLVTDPRGVLVPMMAFLGEPWSDNLLRHHELQSENAPERVEGGTRPARSIDAGALDAWREQLADDEMAALAQTPKPLLRFFGYRLKTAEPARPLDPMLTSAG